MIWYTHSIVNGAWPHLFIFRRRIICRSIVLLTNVDYFTVYTDIKYILSYLIYLTSTISVILIQQGVLISIFDSKSNPTWHVSTLNKFSLLISSLLFSSLLFTSLPFSSLFFCSLLLSSLLFTSLLFYSLLISSLLLSSLLFSSLLFSYLILSGLSLIEWTLQRLSHKFRLYIVFRFPRSVSRTNTGHF